MSMIIDKTEKKYVVAEKRRALRELVYNKYGGKCAYCGHDLATPAIMRIDHIVPVAQDGPNDIENYNPSCLSCNNTKNNLTVEQFRQAIQNAKERLCFNYGQIRFCERMGVLEFKKDVIFYFERCKESEKEEKK